MEYQIKNQYLTVVIEAKGAQMLSISREGTEYLWNGDPAYWSDRSPLLFPYVGRFTEGKYRLRGREYEMDIHGFAKGLTFTAAKQSEASITLEAADDEETYASYPYHFLLGVTYTLKEDTVEITYHVKNRSEETMYFGIGGHPGFRVPLEEGLDFTDYYLEFGECHRPERVGHTKTCFLSGVNEEFPLEEGKKYRLHHGMFDEDAIVLQNVADKVTLKSEKGRRKVTVSYPALPYLGLWHAPGTEAPYICIEPWTSLPSRQDIVEDFEYKHDLIRLAGGQAYENVWTITIQ